MFKSFKNFTVLGAIVLAASFNNCAAIVAEVKTAVLTYSDHDYMVTLADGTHTNKQKIDRVWSQLQAIQTLAREDKKQKTRGGLSALAALWTIVRQDVADVCEDIRIDSRYADTISIFSYCTAVGLCEEDGIIDNETKQIVRQSMRGLFKGVVPLSIQLQYPLSAKQQMGAKIHSVKAFTKNVKK